MANFEPFNRYTFYLLDKLISRHNIKPSFLDVGCGTGSLSKHLVERGWDGKAIDISIEPLKKAASLLKKYPKVAVRKKNVFEENGKYNSIFVWDVIEHVENDLRFLKKLNSLLNKRGYLAISVPSNTSEWRWDDEFYGHFRRYSPKDIELKLKKAKFNIQVIWDTTYPLFWLVRRIYTAVGKKQGNYKNKKVRTLKSGFLPAWKSNLTPETKLNLKIFWNVLYFIQYHIFKNCINRGFSILVLAQKQS